MANPRCPTCGHEYNPYGAGLGFCSSCGHVGCKSAGSIDGKPGCTSIGKGMWPGQTCPICRKGTVKEKK